MYVELEQGKNAEFWKDMTIITEDEMAKLKKIDPEMQGSVSQKQKEIRTLFSLIKKEYCCLSSDLGIMGRKREQS